MTMTTDGPQLDVIKGLLTSLPYDLEVRGIRFVDEGWDNRIYAAGDEALLRVAKNDVASRQLLREANLLRSIAPLLALPVPLPEFIHQPNLEVPFTVMAYRKVPGTSLVADEVEDDAIDPLATELAQFLDELHAIPLDVVEGIGITVFTQDEWLAHHVELVDVTRETVRERLGSKIFTRFERWWDEYRLDPDAVDFTPCFIHGDLGCEHVLVERDPWRVTGVIDFGDAMFADPALDLAGFPDALAVEVLNRMRSLTDDKKVWRRRDFYRRIAPLHAIEVGDERHDFALVHEGIEGLKRRFSV